VGKVRCYSPGSSPCRSSWSARKGETLSNTIRGLNAILSL
jgi:hypothetical protein